MIVNAVNIRKIRLAKKRECRADVERLWHVPPTPPKPSAKKRTMSKSLGAIRSDKICSMTPSGYGNTRLPAGAFDAKYPESPKPARFAALCSDRRRSPLRLIPNVVFRRPSFAGLGQTQRCSDLVGLRSIRFPLCDLVPANPQSQAPFHSQDIIYSRPIPQWVPQSGISFFTLLTVFLAL